MKSILYSVMLMLVASLLSCANQEDTGHVDADEKAEEREEHEGDVVELSLEKQRAMGLETEVVRPVAFGQVIRTMAQVVPSRSGESVVAARTGGVIRLSKPNTQEGTAVNAGEVLATIETAGLTDGNAEVRLSEVAAEYERAAAEYERKKNLAADRIVSQSELSAAKAAYELAKAAYESLRKNFSSGSQAVVFPMSGFVKQIFVGNGDFVETGAPLFTVTDTRHLMVRAEVQPKYFSLLSSIVSANFKFVNNGNTFGLDELGGSVVSYGKSVSADVPLIPVVFQIENKGSILPGCFVETFIKTKSDKLALTVMKDAVVEEMGAYFVFVKESDCHFEKRAVVLGASDGKRMEVVSGVALGEEVVSKGAVFLKLSLASGVLDPHAGHSH